jgi:hypothetical protein
MSETYYYMKEGMVNDKPIGPITLRQIAALLLQGKITARTLAMKAGETDWQRIKDYPDIADAGRQIEAERNQQQQQQAAELEQQNQVAAAEEARRQQAQQQEYQVAMQRQQALQQEQQAEATIRYEQFTSGLKQEGDSQKKFKLVWVAESDGKQLLYSKVQHILSQHGQGGWTFEHMHETVWTVRKVEFTDNPCCSCGAKQRLDYDVTENVMVIIFSVPAALADQFPDIV